MTIDVPRRPTTDAEIAELPVLDLNDAGAWGRYDPTRVITTRPFDEVLEEAAAEDDVPLGPHFERRPHNRHGRRPSR
jgi:hypothetical protein